MRLDPRRIERLDPAMVEVLKKKTPAERVLMGFEANRAARVILAGHFRTRHPEWTDEEIQAAIARRMLGATRRTD